MKKWADKKRRHVEFRIRDLVLIKLNLDQRKRRGNLHKSLMRRYEGPCPIIQKVRKASYKVDLPPTLKKIHPVFHVSCLKPYHEDKEDALRGG
ncbi:hypothetical protein QQ045_014181 [Rhodiola kirilowii]